MKSESSLGPHLICDVRELLVPGRWDLLIAFPPCTYLASSGIHWNALVQGRSQRTEEALSFIECLLGAPVPRICVENPVGVISTRIRPPDQILQPFQYGEDASKRTCLWLKNLPELRARPELRKSGRVVFHNGHDIERWSNQRDDGTSVLGQSFHRSRERSRTYPGIAEAMASQWGSLSPVVRRRVKL